MAPSHSTATASKEDEALLGSFVQGERGAKLRFQLASLHSGASAEEIEEAIQVACDRFVEAAEGITAPGQIYTWIRTTAHRILLREDDHHRRELAVDPSDASLRLAVAAGPGPEQETIEQEDEAELIALVREVADALPERKRNVLALYSSGCKRPEIAERLGISDRAVKRDLLEIMDDARAAIARKAGGGCLRGEPLILRFAYGLAGAAEVEQAQLHMRDCRRCEVLWERLDAWREKAAALLPVPAVEGASPGLLERVVHRAADGVTSVKQQIFGGASQVKQQAAATYYRAVDPTPLAGAKPGAVAALLVSCVTIGGGAATYCAQHDVNPLSAATGLITGEGEEKPAEESPPAEPTYESTAAVPPPSVVEESTTETPAGDETEPQSKTEPKPTAESTPPPEQSFEPASPNYPATEELAAPESESSPSEASPAPASGGGSLPQFGGP